MNNSTHRFDNSDKMDHFLKKTNYHNSSNMKGNLNNPMTIKKI